MIFKDLNKNEINECFAKIDKYLSTRVVKWVKYVDLGCKVIKLVSYSDEFLPLVEKQLNYVLKDQADIFDATLILWNEQDVFSLGKQLSSKFDVKTNIRLRIELLYSKNKFYDMQVIDKDFSLTKPVIDIQSNRGFLIANNKEKNVYYYGVKNLEPEEFIKEGHIFVQFFNNILKTENSNLAHGAVIGLNGDGILMCARGQRGKSTLSVLSMMKGFEYVSDDYLILHKNDKNELLSSPIYSIITLSPKMYYELFDKLEGSRFVSNNARKDKYVFNISNFHTQFKTNYPIKICLFPEIVSDKEPSIRLCTKEEKGRAIVQLIQSTLMQTQDLAESVTVKKMINMIEDYPYYKFNLCHDIEKNTEFLREFMNNLDIKDFRNIGLNKITVDITFDLANILDTESGVIYSMNKFATNIFENLQNGVSPKDILKYLKQYSNKNINLEKEFNVFIMRLKDKSIYKELDFYHKEPIINDEFVVEDDYKLSMTEYGNNEVNELIKENENELCIK